MLYCPSSPFPILSLCQSYQKPPLIDWNSPSIGWLHLVFLMILLWLTMFFHVWWLRLVRRLWGQEMVECFYPSLCLTGCLAAGRSQWWNTDRGIQCRDQNQAAVMRANRFSLIISNIYFHIFLFHVWVAFPDLHADEALSLSCFVFVHNTHR